jgi:hypothetical protein
MPYAVQSGEAGGDAGEAAAQPELGGKWTLHTVLCGTVPH